MTRPVTSGHLSQILGATDVPDRAPRPIDRPTLGRRGPELQALVRAGWEDRWGQRTEVGEALVDRGAQ